MHFHRQMNLLLPYLHDSDEAYQVIMDAITKAHEVVSKMKSMDKEVGQLEHDGVYEPLGNPQVSKTKGRTKGSQNEKKMRDLKMVLRLG
jgi:hypothetical protein